MTTIEGNLSVCYTRAITQVLPEEDNVIYSIPFNRGSAEGVILQTRELIRMDTVMKLCEMCGHPAGFIAKGHVIPPVFIIPGEVTCT